LNNLAFLVLFLDFNDPEEHKMHELHHLKVQLPNHYKNHQLQLVVFLFVN